MVWCSPERHGAVNRRRVLGRWLRVICIPNQSSVAKAFMEFDKASRMKPSANYDHGVDIMEELFKFTLLTHDVSGCLVDRYSGRKQSGDELSKREDHCAIRPISLAGAGLFIQTASCAVP